jgi:hypothetical protein
MFAGLIMRTVLIAAALVGAATPQQFDLTCISAKQNKRTVPFTIKVDLAAGEWCIGKCELVSKLASVTSSLIVLSESNEQGIMAGSRVDRLTGEYYFYENKKSDPLFGYWHQSGTCKPGPFTGFGTDKAKF